MSSGEGAFEAGLSDTEGAGEVRHKIHVLPVFRLPAVRKVPFRALTPCTLQEQTRIEPENRLKEDEELQRMKAVLGLSDTELAVLEVEVSRERPVGREKMRRSPESNGSDDSGDESVMSNDFQLGDWKVRERHKNKPFQYSPEVLSENCMTTCGKGSKGPVAKSVDERHRSKRPRRGQQHWSPGLTHARHKAGRLMDETVISPVNRPSTRYKRSIMFSRSAAGPGRPLKQSPTGFEWYQIIPKSLEGRGIGNSKGIMIDASACSEQLIGSVADAGMMNIVELRQELERSVKQVRKLPRPPDNYILDSTACLISRKPAVGDGV